MTVQDGNPSEEMVSWVTSHLTDTGMFDKEELVLPSRVEAIKRIAYYFEMNDFSVEECRRVYEDDETDPNEPLHSADVVLLFDFCRVSHDTYEEQVAE